MEIGENWQISQSGAGATSLLQGLIVRFILIILVLTREYRPSIGPVSQAQYHKYSSVSRYSLGCDLFALRIIMYGVR